MTVDRDLLQELREAYDKNANGGSVNKDTLGDVFRDAGEPLPAFQIRDICTKLKKEGGEPISFDEFTQLFDELNLGKAKGGKYKQMVDSKGGMTQVSGYEQTCAGTIHSMSDAERYSFTNYINKVLQFDPDCKKYLPIDPESEDLFKVLGDGIILCKMVNVAVPGTIDERAINKAKLNAFTTTENLVLAINSSSSIGCHIINIDSEDIKHGKIHLILGLLWQIIRIASFQAINIKATPDLLCMLREGETPEELLSLSPEELLMRWVNYQIAKVGCTRNMTNYSSDLKDSEIYSYLQEAVMKDKMIHAPVSIRSQSDPNKRAQMVIDNAKAGEVAALVSSYDITSGNSKLNMVFLAEYFNKYPCLTAVDTKLEIIETREEKSYRNWMNSMGVKPFVNYFYQDLTDGLVLLQLMNILSPGSANMEKVNRPPFKANTVLIKKTENCNKVVELAKKFNFSTVGLSGEDIAKGSQLHILGLVWQLMYRYTVQMLQKLSGSNSPMSESEIVAWANEQYSNAGKGMQISSFKDPKVVSSHAIFDLIEVIRPGTVDSSMVKSGSNEGEKLLNAQLAISLARKIGARAYALPEDIVEAKVKMVMTIFACLMMVSYQKS